MGREVGSWEDASSWSLTHAENNDVGESAATQRTSKREQTSRSRQLFKPEPAEGERRRSGSRHSWEGPFRAEPGESTSDEHDADDDDHPCETGSGTIVHVGWQAFHAAACMRLAGGVTKAGRPEKQKRPYDNSKRSQGASYKRVQKSDKFKKNGLSSRRICSVLSMNPCS